MLEAALRLLNINIEDCIILPFDDELKAEDDKVMDVMREALAFGGGDRERVYEQAEVLRKRARQRLDNEPRKGEVKKKPDRVTGKRQRRRVG